MWKMVIQRSRVTRPKVKESDKQEDDDEAEGRRW